MAPTTAHKGVPVKKTLSGVAVLLMASAAVVTASAPANAATREVEVRKGAERKAYGFVNEDTRRACVRAFNSNRNAIVYAEVSGGNSKSNWTDHGGDSDRKCIDLPKRLYPSGVRVRMHIIFVGSTGWSGSDTTYAVLP